VVPRIILVRSGLRGHLSLTSPSNPNEGSQEVQDLTTQMLAKSFPGSMKCRNPSSRNLNRSNSGRGVSEAHESRTCLKYSSCVYTVLSIWMKSPADETANATLHLARRARDRGSRFACFLPCRYLVVIESL
jgi:hypothetical protein